MCSLDWWVQRLWRRNAQGHGKPGGVQSLYDAQPWPSQAAQHSAPEFWKKNIIMYWKLYTFFTSYSAFQFFIVCILYNKCYTYTHIYYFRTIIYFFNSTIVCHWSTFKPLTPNWLYLIVKYIQFYFIYIWMYNCENKSLKSFVYHHLLCQIFMLN